MEAKTEPSSASEQLLLTANKMLLADKTISFPGELKKGCVTHAETDHVAVQSFQPAQGR
jgi:hypothetical protein